MPKLPDLGVFLKKFCDSGSCQCRCFPRKFAQRRPLDLSTPKAQEDIGSCSKCRKSSVAGRILRRTRTGRRGGLGRQAKTRAPRDLRVGRVQLFATPRKPLIVAEPKVYTVTVRANRDLSGSCLYRSNGSRGDELKNYQGFQMNIL